MRTEAGKEGGGRGGRGALDDALDDGDRINKEVAQRDVVKAVGHGGDCRVPELEGQRAWVGAAQRLPVAVPATLRRHRRAAQHGSRQRARCHHGVHHPEGCGKLSPFGDEKVLHSACV